MEIGSIPKNEFSVMIVKTILYFEKEWKNKKNFLTATVQKWITIQPARI